MKALVFRGNKAIQYEEVADPELTLSTDVIVKVGITTICGSDLHVYHGREYGLDHGTVMGHEITGEIVAIGKDVKQFKIGQRVVSPFTTNCGHCYFCQVGLTSRCESGEFFGWRTSGNGLHGAQAEYVRVPMADSTLCDINDIPYEHAILTACNLGTGWYAAEMAEVKAGGTYAVIGCGTVGLMSILSAKAMGAEKIFALDAIPERLALAEAYGAIPINYMSPHLSEQIRDATNGIGLDASMEVVGSPNAVRLAYDLVRPGGIISAVGVHSSPSWAFSPGQAYDKNLTYKVGRCPARKYIPTLLEQIKSGLLEIDKVLTHRYSLSKGVEGYDLFDKRKSGCVKLLLDPS